MGILTRARLSLTGLFRPLGGLVKVCSAFSYKRRTFQTTVGLRYCPLEEDAAKRSVMSGQRPMTYAILKVMDSGVTRLS